MDNKEIALTYTQFMNEFGRDYRLEWLADQYYWDTHEGEWDEYTRDEYIKYCEDNGCEVIFD